MFASDADFFQFREYLKIHLLKKYREKNTAFGITVARRHLCRI